MVTPDVERQAVAHLCVAYAVSQRRACRTIGADRRSMRYGSIRPDDAALHSRLRDLAAQPPRFGHRRLLLLLRRKGARINHKKLRRLYREERLQVRKRGRRKRALGTKAPMKILQGRIQRWSLDLSAINSRTAAGSFWARRMILRASAWRLSRIHRSPACAPRMNSTRSSAGGPSSATTAPNRPAWLNQCQVSSRGWLYIALGKPTKNAFIESCSGMLRDELLDAVLFDSLAHGWAALAAWKIDCTTSGRTVRSPMRRPSTPKSAVPRCSGTGRLNCVGLRFTPRCITEPTQLKWRSDSSRLLKK
jgi:putative transposase